MIEVNVGNIIRVNVVNLQLPNSDTMAVWHFNVILKEHRKCQ